MQLEDHLRQIVYGKLNELILKAQLTKCDLVLRRQREYLCGGLLDCIGGDESLAVGHLSN